jgi:serine/threonine-protein kinase
MEKLGASVEENPTASADGDTLPLEAAIPRSRELGDLATIAATPSVPSPVTLETGAHVARDARFTERYEHRALLGEGGMGTVGLFRDRAIGREVAIKRIRSETSSAASLSRFVREACVQGQLEHPAIVPVHDLAETPDGTAFFTMKRVRGASLDAILDALAARDAEALARHGRRKLLTAFATVCLAVDFAHARGVLHRDLKPANVMLGDFGEVYVLDWGLAKVLGARPEASEAQGAAASDESPGSLPPVVDVGSVQGQKTQLGALMGTPGYMSPEQCRGEVDQLGPASDVYALGCILFEILHLEALHPGKGMAERMASTLTGVTMNMPREHASDVPPELERLWRDAVAIDVGARIATARELAERVERYLDGERDEARRCELASAHVDRAAAIDMRTAAGRAEAMRELGRALALDPSHEAALRALARALTDLPDEVPAEAQAAIERARTERRVQMARTSAVRLGTWILVIPAVVAFGVTSWARGAALITSLLATAAMALFAWRTRSVSDAWTLALLGASSVAIGLVSFVFGPFVLVPSLAATNAIFFAMNADARLRRFVVGASVAAVLVPLALSLGGIEPGYYAFEGGAMTITSPMVAFPPVLVMGLLFVVSIALVVTPTLLAGRMRDELARAEEKVLLQAHYLAQLVPEAARR